MNPATEHAADVEFHARLGLEVGALAPTARRGTEEVVAQELDSFLLESLAPGIPASRSRRSYSTAPQARVWSASPSRQPGGPGVAAGVPTTASVAEIGLTLGQDTLETARSSSMTGKAHCASRDRLAGVTGLSPTSPAAAHLRQMPSGPEDPSRKRSNTLLSGLKRVSSRSILGMGSAAGYARISATGAEAPSPQMRGFGAESPVSIAGAPSGLGRMMPMHDVDDSREDLQNLVRNVSATNFEDLHEHMRAVQADMDCFDTCVICGEFGKCAPFTCCKTPRHLRCEMEFSKANRLHWRLASATTKADGTKAFKKLHPPASEAEYAAQLMGAGTELYQLLRCSVCRKPLAAVRAAGDFAPLQWDDIAALREDREVRDVVSMRGSHPYRQANGCCQRFAALTGYASVQSLVRWQLPWLMGVVVVGAMILFVFNVFSARGDSDLAPQVAIAVPVSFVLVCCCWSCSHHGAATATLRQLEEEEAEEAAVSRPSLPHSARAISTSSAVSGLGSSDFSPSCASAPPVTGSVGQACPVAPAPRSIQSPLFGALQGGRAPAGSRLGASTAAFVGASAPSSTENLVALSSRSAALPPV